MVMASRATSMSGCGAKPASKAPANSARPPHQRQDLRQIASHNPPSETSTNADSGMALDNETAPGSSETQSPIATITPIPSPSRPVAKCSSPYGISTTASAAAGMIQKPITGMAIRFPSTA